MGFTIGSGAAQVFWQNRVRLNSAIASFEHETGLQCWKKAGQSSWSPSVSDQPAAPSPPPAAQSLQVLGDPVKVPLEFQNIVYSSLMADSSLRESFIQTVVAEVAKDAGVPSTSVSVTINPGKASLLQKSTSSNSSQGSAALVQTATSSNSSSRAATVSIIALAMITLPLDSKIEVGDLVGSVMKEVAVMASLVSSLPGMFDASSGPITTQVFTLPSVYRALGQGWCRGGPPGNTQASLCATDFALGSLERGNRQPANPSTCKSFSSEGYSTQMGEAAARLICDSDPNCYGFTFADEASQVFWHGRVRLNSEVSAVEPEKGLRCYKKVPVEYRP